MKSNRLLGWISDQLTMKYYDFEFMTFYWFKNTVIYLYCLDYTNSDLQSWEFRLISWSYITQCDADFLFHPPPTHTKNTSDGIFRNNLITCRFLTRCIIIRKHIKRICLPQNVAMLFLPDFCFYASRWWRCENSNIIWREKELVAPLLYVYDLSNKFFLLMSIEHVD